MITLSKTANPYRTDSLSFRMRRRRFELFERLASGLDRPLRILDIGGMPKFWELHDWHRREDVRITIINLKPRVTHHANMETRFGDATNLREYPDGSFDIAFSNSVIEHLFTQDSQAAMAREMQRVAPNIFLQTPNYWFPIEPHFHVPGWQWLPRGVRIAMFRRVRCGWRGPCRDRRRAAELIDEIRLMTRRELAQLFPRATIVPEMFAGLVKSWIVHQGFRTVSRRLAA